MPDRRFLVQGPAIISVSGGRSSGYLLHAILDAHDGKLPPDVHAVFANTGREMDGTLDFVRDQAAHWGVHIQWLEYRRDPETGRRWAEEVSHNSASRQGEPFEMLLVERGYMLPGPKMRHCTQELKIRTLQRWVTAELKWPGRYRSYLGLRGDELHRVHRIGLRNGSGRERWIGKCPMARARISKPVVNAWWRLQPFDLQLAGDWEGNCDGCFMKRVGAIRRMQREHPERMSWWPKQEALAVEHGYTHGRFRIDRPGYAWQQQYVDRNPLLPGLDQDDDGLDLLTDDCEGGCGI
jgi:3'-phosphoadenosine 5'-phosphosulfate sulfotransferase (PAPS reductase)/FAD synthetase